jgi:hypothetical protein
MKHSKEAGRINIAALFITFLIFFALSGCNAGETIGKPADNTINTDESDESEVSLNDFEGWWTRPEDYVSEGISVIDNFKIDASAGTWTVYNEYGAKGETLNCYTDNGNLTLETYIFGEVTFYYDGYGLYAEENGQLHFIPGEPIEAVNTSLYEGKWYRNGNTGDDWYSISGENFEYYNAYSPDELSQSGKWHFEDSRRIFEDRESIREKIIVFVENPDEPFGSENFALTEDETAFFDIFNKTLYIHEDSIGTRSSDSLITAFTLAFNNWEGPEFGDPYIYFDWYEKTFGMVIYDDSGTGNRSHQGTWSADGTTITFEFTDGETEDTTITDDSFYLERYEMTFTNDVF